ncbi:hypothetical protein BT96DRAFT_785151, partial [Gymnopus androsaceus JB14]
LYGDRNIVEDGFDWTTGKPDQYDAMEALVQFKSLFQMKDGWQEQDPTAPEFTHTHWGQNGTATSSRIDHVYARDE